MTFARLHAQRGVNHRAIIRYRLLLKIAARGRTAALEKRAVAAHDFAMGIAQRGAKLEQRLRMRDFPVGFRHPG